MPRGPRARLELRLDHRQRRQLRLSTNALLFPCSYYHYYQFYNDDAGSVLMVGTLPEVRYPSRKAQSPCYATSTKIGGPGGHGGNGWALMFVDGHSQFARYIQLYPGTLEASQPGLDHKRIAGLRSALRARARTKAGVGARF